MRISMAAVILVLVAFGVSAAIGSSTQNPGQPDFHAIARDYGARLAAVRSDTEANALFSALTTALHLDLPSSAASGKPERRAADQSVSQVEGTSVQLIRELAVLRLAAVLQQAVQSDPRTLASLLQEHSAHLQWLKPDSERDLLDRLIKLAAVLSSFEAPRPLPSDAVSDYGHYVAFLDRPDSSGDGSDDSWITIAERDGAEGIRRRLREFWEPDGDSHERPRITAEPDLLTGRYFERHVRPLLTARLSVLAVRTEADAEGRARLLWEALKTRDQQRRKAKGRARLCGTWQWTIHNHKNHQDHKAVMVFPPADGAPAASTPTKIVVLGDVVYLRWEFPGGYQEESLLFSNEGQRLEGTFLNSTGAWGSITGKRTAPCR